MNERGHRQNLYSRNRAEKESTRKSRRKKNRLIQLASGGILTGIAAAGVLAAALIFGDHSPVFEVKAGSAAEYGEEYLMLDELGAGQTEREKITDSGNMQIPGEENTVADGPDSEVNQNGMTASGLEPDQEHETGQDQEGSQNVAGIPVSSENTSEDDWKLILVNRWNPIPEEYELTLTGLVNDQSVDSRIYPELQQMFDDARAAGMMPQISSSYRTAKMQQELMDEKIAEYQAEGNSYEDAKALAEKWVAIPGTSEHQIGIAVDITTADWQQQDASVIWQWLEQNSYRYGFILRYTAEKTDITGVIAEPWHFRYVGKEAAKEIYEQGVCLEEYLDATGK